MARDKSGIRMRFEYFDCFEYFVSYIVQGVTTLSHMPTTETLVPTDQEQQLARTSSRLLSRPGIELHVLDPRQQDEFVLVPARVAQMFAHILNQFAQGKAVTIVPNEAMLTTQDAADFLNVSRPFLIKLLAQHNVLIQKVGNRRKIPLTEVQRLKEILQTNSREALTELAKLDEELGLE
jgi:excisionase family DNA binding protein